MTIGKPSHKPLLSDLSLSELEELAASIRRRIIEVLSKNGGHLSSNLGVVELTIALHRVFQSPKDRFIFDVSHQTYPHKILTDRDVSFDRIRQYKGLCGFAHPKESLHDHFFAGHAGTALSLALGMAKEKELQEGDEHILAILGDASLTCGLTLEALNNVPKTMNNFIAVLNDNAMSISENVGNIKHVLSRLLSNPTSNKLYAEIRSLLRKIPGCGPLLEKLSQKMTESMKNLVSPATFFEEFNFSYVGPIDGHDIGKLVETLEELKNTKQPVFLHVLTIKGKGMPIAIQNPTSYHGAKPFDLCSGKFLPSPAKNPTFPKIFGRHILELAHKHPEIICITAATPAGSCLEEFMKVYPQRCIDVGIAEGHAVTFAGGLGKTKKQKVFVSIYATFFQRALDNLFHDVCMQQIPVVFTLDRAFISGPDGSTHHGIYDIGFLNAMPNLIIAQPRDGQVLKELLNASLSWESPAAIRYPNLETKEDSVPKEARKIGKGQVLKEGKDVLLIGLGHMCNTALEVQKLLGEKGIDAAVIDPIFIKPLDKELLLERIPRYPLIATIEEHSLQGGLGMILSHFIVQNLPKSPRVLHFGIPDKWVQFGSNRELMQELGLDAISIAKRIIEEFPRDDHSTVSQREKAAIV